MNNAKNKQMIGFRWASMKNSLFFYSRFGSKIIPGKNDQKTTINMEFIFDRDGFPEENRNQYYLKKAQKE